MANIYVNITGEPLEHIFIFEAVFYLTSATSSLLWLDYTVTNYLVGDQAVCFYNIGLFEAKRVDPGFPK
jgi:hypothetical protein